MRHVREILRLSLGARLSTRAVAEHVRTGATTVRDTLRRFDQSGLSWPLPPEIDDADQEERLYGVPVVIPNPFEADSLGFPRADFSDSPSRADGGL